MGIWNKRFRTILVFTLLIVVGIGIGRLSGQPLSLTGAVTGGQCELVEAPHEVCRDVAVPYEYMANYEEEVPYLERECKKREFLSDASVISYT